jgi:hypothetical protein
MVFSGHAEENRVYPVPAVGVGTDELHGLHDGADDQRDVEDHFRQADHAVVAGDHVEDSGQHAETVCRRITGEPEQSGADW